MGFDLRTAARAGKRMEGRRVGGGKCPGSNRVQGSSTRDERGISLPTVAAFRGRSGRDGSGGFGCTVTARPAVGLSAREVRRRVCSRRDLGRAHATVRSSDIDTCGGASRDAGIGVVRGAPAVELLQVRVDLAVDRGAETTRSLGAAAADAMMHRLAVRFPQFPANGRKRRTLLSSRWSTRLGCGNFEGAGANKSM